MRRVSLIALAALYSGLGASAFAQAPVVPDATRKAAKKPAASSLGIDKEDGAFEPLPTPKKAAPSKAAASLTHSTDAEGALLRALLFAFEPAPQEIRVQSVEDLGLLGDARALNPLAQLVLDGNPTVQSAAVRSVGLFQVNRAEEILCNVVRHPPLPDKLKVQAIEALVFQRSPTAREFLGRIANNRSFTTNVQSAARRALGEVGAEPARP